jgi:hypothetical protein
LDLVQPGTIDRTDCRQVAKVPPAAYNYGTERQIPLLPLSSGPLSESLPNLGAAAPMVPKLVATLRAFIV